MVNYATGKEVRIPRVRELAASWNRTGVGRLQVGDRVQIARLSRTLFDIIGLEPDTYKPANTFDVPGIALSASTAGLAIGGRSAVLHGDNTLIRGITMVDLQSNFINLRGDLRKPHDAPIAITSDHPIERKSPSDTWTSERFRTELSRERSSIWTPDGEFSDGSARWSLWAEKDIRKQQPIEPVNTTQTHPTCLLYTSPSPRDS